MMRKWLLFAAVGVLFVAGAACSDETIQTPTSDRNFDDEGDPGQHNDPAGTGDGGKRDGGPTFDSGPLPDAMADATADVIDAAMLDAPANDAANDAAGDAAAD